MNDLLQDLFYGFRRLKTTPVFTAIAVLTLALGIGANTAIFSVIDGVLFRSLPYKDSERLVLVWGKHAGRGEELQQVSFLDFSDIRNRNDVFDETAAMFVRSFTLSGEGQAERVRGLLVSANIFRLLGVEAAHGRTFLLEEGRPGNDKVVVLSHRLWQNRFGADSNIIGKSVTINDESRTVTGVLPQGFDLEFPLDRSFSIKDNDLWMPLASDHNMAGNRAVFTYEVIAKLKAGVTVDQARSNLAVIGQQLEQAHPESNKGRAFDLVPLLDQVVGNVRSMLFILLATVGAVLLIACVNLANLLLGRAAMRRKEIAIRSALGAGRWRIVRQLLTESLLLALAGGMAGVILALWAVDLLVSFQGVELPRAEEISIDGRVMGFTLGLSILTGLLFGLLPALTATRYDLQGMLKEGGQKAGVSGHKRLRGLLIVSEIAMAFVLLAMAGLLTKSFYSLLNVNPGFKTERALTFVVSPPAARFSKATQVAEFYKQLLTGLESLPGVVSAAAVSSLPLSGHNTGSAVRVEGRTLSRGEQPPGIGWQFTLPGYFRTMGIPILQGRDFSEEDISRSQHVTIINEALAREVFPGENPIGKRVTYGVPGPQTDWHEIIGIVGDAHHQSLDEMPRPRGYDLLGQSSGLSMSLIIRASGDPATLAGAARQKVQELEPGAPVYMMETMYDLIARSTASRRFSMLLVGGFALISLILAAVGIYGVLSYIVSQRTHEIGIRIALGAGHGRILSLIVGQGFALTLIGTAIGWAAALLLTRFLSSLLFEISPTDTGTLATITLILISTALLACYIPARRAAKVDPMEALRYE